MTPMAIHLPRLPQRLKEMDVARMVEMITAPSLPMMIEVSNRWGRAKSLSTRDPDWGCLFLSLRRARGLKEKSEVSAEAKNP